jgi:hypothetical protein
MMSSPTPRATPWQRRLVYLSFALGCLVSLWVPLYDRVEPSIAGIPFFYWFQVLWIVVVACATAIAYRLGV